MLMHIQLSIVINFTALGSITNIAKQFSLEKVCTYTVVLDEVPTAVPFMPVGSL